jgi:arginine/lysine/ornithine decarboxylase
MNHDQTPLFDALHKHTTHLPVSFHVPGHKNGQILPEKARHYFQRMLPIDVTELTGLDDLHAPEDVIQEAESLLAAAYGVKESFFLVNGSTVGNLTMILASFNEEDMVFVQKNCHKSVLNALKLAKLQPVFIEPDYNHDWKVATGLSISSVEAAYQAYPEVKGIILTYPNYYGFTYDLKSIIEFCHAMDMVVLVDEAHGAHFIAGTPFPLSAVQLGADMVTQSAHKTLPAMTMASYLHLNSNRIDRQRVIFLLQALQSSSPSYPLMASLDLARSFIATYDKKDKDNLIMQRKAFLESLKHIDCIKVLTHTDNGDILKIVIQSTKGQSGFALQKKLEKAGVFPELADSHNVLLIFPLLKSDTEFDLNAISQRIKRAFLFPEEQTLPSNRSYPLPMNRKIYSCLSLNYREQAKKGKTFISLNQSIGRVSAEIIIPYPPGIPLVMEGEEITLGQIKELKQLIKLGARFHGGEYLHEQKIKVFE